MHTKETELVLF